MASLRTRWQQTRDNIAQITENPFFIATLPALMVLLYWLGGQTALVAVAILVPLLLLVSSNALSTAALRSVARSATLGVMQRDGFEVLAETTFEEARKGGLKTTSFMVEIDDFDRIAERHGLSAAETVLDTVGKRILSSLRERDAVSQTGDHRFAICLAPVNRLDLELCIQLSGRMQTAIEEPISIDGITIYVTGCVGFCQNTRMISSSAKAWLDAAGLALREAQLNGPNAIRAYSEEMKQRSETQAELSHAVTDALENGDIHAWFQPQISTDTGLVTGFEALARWRHPTRGMISPGQFLPIIEQAGLLERLAEVMIHQAFTALQNWDQAGLNIPQVGVNFAGPELNNPKLVEKLKWELDRFDLAPERLSVEVLETVVTDTPDDTVTRNINALNELGCKIDLDDFGTGHASISSIRRFSVTRIKIDRSFVMKSDRDPEQQRMISAILTMAERLNIETLAEGVETVGEHALLAQLGCDHVQGFGIAKPMPFDETQCWIENHNAKLATTPQIVINKSR